MPTKQMRKKAGSEGALPAGQQPKPHLNLTVGAEIRPIDAEAVF